MATAGEMTRIYADALGLTEPSVAIRYRALREAGMVAKAARGRYTPDRSTAEAARLLIALLGAQAVADAPPATCILAQLKGQMAKGPASMRRHFEFVTFERAVEMVLEDCYALSIGEPASFGITGTQLAINVSQTRLTGRVESGSFCGVFFTRNEVHGAPTAAPAFREAMERLSRMSGFDGMAVEARVEGPQLMKLAQALKPTAGSAIG